MPLGKGRNNNERNPEAELIKAGALIRKRAGWVGGKSCAKSFFRVQADLAIRAAAKLLAGGRVREISTLPRSDFIRCPRATLRRARRLYVIVRPAVLVIGNENKDRKSVV